MVATFNALTWSALERGTTIPSDSERDREIIGHTSDDLGGDEPKLVDRLARMPQAATLINGRGVVIWHRDDVPIAAKLHAAKLIIPGPLLDDLELIRLIGQTTCQPVLATLGTDCRSCATALRTLSGISNVSPILLDDGDSTIAPKMPTVIARSSLMPPPGETPESARSRASVARRQWFVRTAVPVGAKLKASDIVLRAGTPTIRPLPMDCLVGKTVCRSMSPGDLVTRANLEMRVWALVAIRSDSRRMPGKALIDVAGMPALLHLLARLKQCRMYDNIVVCTTTLSSDDALARIAAAAGYSVHRGSMDNMLSRLLGAIAGADVDVIARITGDDILIEPTYADLAVQRHLEEGVEYSDMKLLPAGTETELFDVGLLTLLSIAARQKHQSEHLTYFATANRDCIATQSIRPRPRHVRALYLSIDWPEDYRFVNAILTKMRDTGRALTYSIDDLLDAVDANPHMVGINRKTLPAGTRSEMDASIDWARWASGATD